MKSGTGLLALAALGVLALASTGKSKARPEAPTKECPTQATRVLLIGDSLAVGLGPVMVELAEKCGTPFSQRSFIGAHVTQWHASPRLTDALSSATPTVVLISLGGNDFQRSDPEKVRGAIDTLVDRIMAQGARPLWISPPSMPFSDRIGVREMWRSALRRHPGAAWFATEELQIGRAPDQIHPTAAGYRELAQLIWEWMSTLTW